MLRPSETLHRLLLSSPARFVAEYEADGFALAHAWDLERFRDERSPLMRTFLMLSFTTGDLVKAPGVSVPDYSPTGQLVCALLAVLFGKRFDHHGPVEMTGRFHVPDLGSAADLCEPTRPYHGPHLRADYPVALDLREVRRIEPLLVTGDDDPKSAASRDAFQTAALFYARALRAVARDPEVAYLHLITACERLAELAPLKGIEHEAQIRNALGRIERELADGARIANLFRGRMRQLRRRFAALISAHADAAFFAHSEADERWEALRAEDFPAAALAAYDLRSRYVHTGQSFGGWIAPSFRNGERQFGKPIVPDKDMSKLLARAPTFVGLERLTRLVLLKSAERLGVKLPPPAPPPEVERDGPHTHGTPAL